MLRKIGVSRNVKHGGALHAVAVGGHIDEIGIVGGEAALGEALPQGGQIAVRGWLLDRESGHPLGRLQIGIDGGSAVDAVLGLPRPDVADVVDWAVSSNGGFYAIVPIDTE